MPSTILFVKSVINSKSEHQTWPFLFWYFIRLNLKILKEQKLADHSFDLLDELDNDLDVDVDAVVRADVYVVMRAEGDKEKGVAVDEDVDLIVELDVD